VGGSDDVSEASAGRPTGNESQLSKMNLQKIVGLVIMVVQGLSSTPALAEVPMVELTRQHVDLRMVYQPETTNLLALLLHDGDSNRTYHPDEAILVVAEEALFLLPPGTPFGQTGDPLWILPQSQDPDLLYLGTDAGGIPQGVFTGPLNFQLTGIQGPGHFYLWQAGEFGGLTVRMNTSNGITDDDRSSPIAASHEHFNWGFSTSGVYRLTFQLSGQRLGETTNVFSPDTTFTFHVLPLPELTPFELWQQIHWPHGAPDAIQGPAADPDGDGIPNAMEYFLGLNPLTAGRDGVPDFATVLVDGIEHGALRFHRAKAATDVSYEVVASTSLDGSWHPLSDIHELTDYGDTELVVVRDNWPRDAFSARFYQLQIQFHDP
jgi:surface-anchored protein